MAYLGMFDLIRADRNPLTFVDHFWHALGLIISSPPDSENVRVILIGQPRQLRQFPFDHMYGEWVGAFHSHLLCRAEGFPQFSFLFMADFLQSVALGEVWLGLAGAGIGDISPHDLPYNLYLLVNERCIAWLLSPNSESISLFLTDPG